MPIIHWRTGTSGDWSQGSNWIGGVAPGAGDDAFVDASGTYTVTISTAISTNSLTLNASGATVTETAAGSLTLAGALNLEAGTFQLNSGTTSVGGFTQTGGELAGTGTVTVSGATELSGGIMEGGSASLRQGNLVAQGALTITAAGNGVGAALDGGWTLTAEGTTTWTSGNIYFGPPFAGTIGGTNTLVNAAGATFDDQNTANYNIIQQAGSGVFDNAGLFDKTAASGASTTTIGTAFNNSGILEVDAGTVDLIGGGTSTGSFTGAGTVEFGAGTTNLATGSSVTAANVTFGGGTTNIAGTYDVSRGTTVTGGTANLTAAVTSLGNALTITGGTLNLGANNPAVTTFTQSGGELAGTGTLTVSGSTALSGGIMEGGSASLRQGNLVAQGALTITAAGNGVGAVLDGGWTLTAEGTTTWTSGNIYFGSPFAGTIGGTNTLVNAAGATFDDQNTANSNIIQQAGSGVFDNAGLFDKTAASGASTTTIGTAFNNSGILEVDAGTVDLIGGGTSTGSFTGAGTVEFGAGTTNLATGSSVTAASAIFGGGTTNIAGTYDVSGGTTVTGGTANRTAAVTSLGNALTITGARSISAPT